MKDKLSAILIGVIAVLAVVIIFLLSTKGDQRTDNYKQTAEETGMGQEQPVAAAGGQVATQTPPAKNYMEPQLPPTLTDVQKEQLKAGVADHAPTELTFNITGGSFFFTPNEIRVKEGDKVKIIFTNVGGMHNLILDAFKAQTKTIKTDESDTIEFTADKKGTYEYYCGVGNGYHRQMGQVGVLLVE